MGTVQINWQECAPIKILNQAADKVVVGVAGYMTAANEDMQYELTNAQLLNDVGPFELGMPFSLRSCVLISKSTKESYVLSSMFPGMKRRLSRRVSEEEGAVNAMRRTAGQAALEKTIKKSKSKALSATFKLGCGAGGKNASIVKALEGPPAALEKHGAEAKAGAEGKMVAAAKPKVSGPPGKVAVAKPKVVAGMKAVVTGKVASSAAAPSSPSEGDEP